MELTDIALRAVGAFYAFAGLVATRAAIMSAFLDAALAKISLKATPLPEKLRTAWLFAAAVGVFAGGLALAVQLDAAIWLFIASALAQAVYLALLAPLYFDAADPPDAKGRQGSVNAFAIYLLATAFVLWAGQHGKLQPLMTAAPAAIAIVCAGASAYLWYLARALWSALRPPPSTGDDEPN